MLKIFGEKKSFFPYTKYSFKLCCGARLTLATKKEKIQPIKEDSINVFKTCTRFPSHSATTHSRIRNTNTYTFTPEGCVEKGMVD